MKVESLNQGSIKSLSKLSFGAGKSILYSDFDGTFLAQPLYDVYDSDAAQKHAGIENFNRYFAQIKEFIDKTKGKFQIIITTGRRFLGDRKEGFEPTYQKMREEGLRLPKIKSVVISNGGDVFNFREDGSIEKTPDPLKAKAVKDACGWDNVEIKAALDEVSKQTGVGYEFVDSRGSYKLSVKLSDTSKVEDFYSRLIPLLEEKMQIESKVGKVRVSNFGETSYYMVRGIRLEPKVNGGSLCKDFDVRAAMRHAVQNNDFLLVAGNADNDKEMLNIFSYVKVPEGMKRPEAVGEITDEYIRATKGEIENLPLKIFFVKSEIENPKTFEVFKFMEEQERIFPGKVQVLEETQVGRDNVFLDAITTSISDYASKNSTFKNALENTSEFLNGADVRIPKKNGKLVLALLAVSAVAAGIGTYIHKKTAKKKLQKT